MTIQIHACLECGGPVPKSYKRPEFCRAECRIDFNNRRKARGAELYDLYMAHRFQRGLSAELGLFQAVNRLASNYRAEDRAARDGRRSWRQPKAVLAERPHLKSTMTQTRIGR